MPNEFLQRVERHVAETAVEARGVFVSATATVATRGYHIPVHRAQVFQEVGLLLEHGDAQPENSQNTSSSELP